MKILYKVLGNYWIISNYVLILFINIILFTRYILDNGFNNLKFLCDTWYISPLPAYQNEDIDEGKNNS